MLNKAVTHVPCLTPVSEMYKMYKLYYVQFAYTNAGLGRKHNMHKVSPYTNLTALHQFIALR